MIATKASHALLATLLLSSSVSISSAAEAPELHKNTLAFGDELTSKLYSNPNECTSSLGVSMAFALVYPSMTGDALDETQEAFGFSKMDDNSTSGLEWDMAETQLEADNNATCLNNACSKTGPTLSISNIIYTDASRTLSSDYKAVAGKYVKETDFSDADVASKEINDWVDDATSGLISEIVDPGQLAGLMLIAINAIYLKANWASEFIEMHTNEDIFYTSANRETIFENESVNNTVSFMHKVGAYPYYQNTKTQVLQIPFAGSDSLSMVFALPIVPDAATDNNDDSMMTATKLMEEVLPQVKETRVAVALPKFTITASYDDALQSSLKEIGVEAPFTGGLCFFESEDSNTTDCSPKIDTILQKTYISIDEAGVEAAAVTALLSRTSLSPVSRDIPVLFQADHPFQFFIVDKDTHLVLFEGRVAEPESKAKDDAGDDNAMPMLQARHADASFWNATFGAVPKTARQILSEQVTESPMAAPTPVGTNDGDNNASAGSDDPDEDGTSGSSSYRCLGVAMITVLVTVFAS